MNGFSQHCGRCGGSQVSNTTPEGFVEVSCLRCGALEFLDRPAPPATRQPTMRRIAGMSEGDLQTFLGHSSPVMTRHYSQFALARSANQATIRTSPIDRLGQQG